ncbi:MAG: cation transporter [Eubacteriales bacterium]|nr:cation transporter [Eubacteriales bacterium]
MNEDAEKYEKAQASAFLNFLMEILNYVALIVSVILTFSISMLMDMLTSTCNLTRTGICYFLNKKLQKNLKFTYNYGSDRLEVLATVFCDFLMVLGSLFILGFAVYRIIVPSGVSDLIIVAVIFKIICVLADVGILLSAYSAYKKAKTKVAKTVFEGMVSSFAFDAGIMLSVLLAMILRSWSGVVYVEPVISILIAVITVIRTIGRIRVGVHELSDLTLEEDAQMKILKVVNAHYHEFNLLNSINSHRFGQTVIVDFDFDFLPETTYAEMQRLIDKILEELNAEFSECKVYLHITGK